MTEPKRLHFKAAEEGANANSKAMALARGSIDSWLSGLLPNCSLQSVSYERYQSPLRIAAALDCLRALVLGLFLLRLIRRMSSIATEEDRARWSYGKTFGELTEMEKDRVKHQMRYELQSEGKVQDEREAAMQRDAEGYAFRLLRRGLPGLVLVWWAVGLFMPIGQVRTGLLFSALASTGLVIVVLSLPELICVWMMPSPLGEPYLVMGGPKEV
jgi:hypothetical protein